MPFTPDETTLILRAIREIKPFRDKFAEKADVIVDKVYSYFTSANCPCKGAIVDWLGKNETAAREVINTFSADIDKLKQTPPPTPPTPPVPPRPALPGQPVPGTPPNVKIGETLAIDPNPESYKKLFDKIKEEKWVFRGLQVIPGEDDSGRDVWFILFY